MRLLSSPEECEITGFPRCVELKVPDGRSLHHMTFEMFRPHTDSKVREMGFLILNKWWTDHTRLLDAMLCMLTLK